MQQHCDNCDHQNSCQDIYSKLGNCRSSSVFLKVVMAFLLPLVLFIVAAATAESQLAGRLVNVSIRNIAVFAIGSGVVFAYLLIVKLWRIKH